MRLRSWRINEKRLAFFGLRHFKHVPFDGLKKAAERGGISAACRALVCMQLRQAHHEIEHDGKWYDIAGVIEIIHLQSVLDIRII